MKRGSVPFRCFSASRSSARSSAMSARTATVVFFAIRFLGTKASNHTAVCPLSRSVLPWMSLRCPVAFLSADLALISNPPRRTSRTAAILPFFVGNLLRRLCCAHPSVLRASSFRVRGVLAVLARMLYAIRYTRRYFCSSPLTIKVKVCVCRTFLRLCSFGPGVQTL